MTNKYIEKYTPLVVEAEPFDPKNKPVSVALDPNGETGLIHQPDGQYVVSPGDMIVTYADGQIKPMLRAVFDATFRKATKSDAPALPASTDS